MAQVLPSIQDCCSQPCPCPTTGLNSSNTLRGEAQLIAGVATVFTSAVSANSAILLSRSSLLGDLTTVGENRLARVPGVSFQIISADPTDTALVDWAIT